MSQEALDLLLSGVKDQGRGKQITTAYYAFGGGDRETFAVQCAVLLRAHALSLKALPERLQKTLATETYKLSDLMSAHQASMNKVASWVSQADDDNGVGEGFGQIERRIEEGFALYSEALRAERTNIMTAIAASDRILKQVAAHRIVLGLFLSYTAGELSVLAVHRLLPFLF